MATARNRRIEKAPGADGPGVPGRDLEDARRRVSPRVATGMSNWLNGAALMREIDLSVLTWCSDHEPEDAVFHGALLDPKDPTDEELELGWRNFFEMHGRPPKALREVVFRRPTWEHIPSHYGWREAPGQGIAATGLPFQPFEHWRYIRNCPRCVLRSHWIGNPEGGRFRTPTDPQGRLTETLGRMIVEMVERYGSKFNWRGYTCIDDMKADARLALAHSILKFSPIKSSNPFAYATQTMKTSFIQSKNTHSEGWKSEQLLGGLADNIGHEGVGMPCLHSHWNPETSTETADREFAAGQRAFDLGK